MSRSKTATPAATDHPAQGLTYLDEEMKSALLKTPVALVLEQDTYKLQLKELRNDWRYACVIQWLYFFRGAIKLSGEPFTVDLLEEELVGLTEPNLINKIPSNLAAVLLGTKVTIDDFSFRARFLLGDTTSVLGTEETPVDYQALSLVDKFEVLYCLISQLQYTDIFRAQVEKYEKENELRLEPIFDDDRTSFYLLSDNRIYKRTITNFPEMKVPRKFRDAKLINPLEQFANIEPEVSWEVVAIGIYQIHEFLVSLKGNKKMKPLFDNIKEHINVLAQDDLNTRKKILKRKREQKLHDLVSHRKRSSRLVEKEEQLRAEAVKREEQEKQIKKEQEHQRAQRRYKQKVSQLKKEIEERLKRQTQSRRSAILEEYKPSNTDDIELSEGDWLFDCYCGIREKNYDDGVKMISCERCHRWQHLKCQDRAVRQELATKADEVLICQWCLNDLEKEIGNKIEAEIKLEEERELERQRQKELQREIQRRKMEEDRKRIEEAERMLEEAERKRKEEMEKERQRRFLERQAVSAPASSEPETPTIPSSGPAATLVETQPPVQVQQPTIQQHQTPSIPQAPQLGTFQQQAFIPTIHQPGIIPHQLPQGHLSQLTPVPQNFPQPIQQQSPPQCQQQVEQFLPAPQERYDGSAAPSWVRQPVQYPQVTTIPEQPQTAQLEPSNQTSQHNGNGGFSLQSFNQ